MAEIWEYQASVFATTFPNSSNLYITNSGGYSGQTIIGFRAPRQKSNTVIKDKQALIIFGTIGTYPSSSTPVNFLRNGIPENQLVNFGSQRYLLYSITSSDTTDIAARALIECIHTMEEEEYAKVLTRYFVNSNSYHYIMSIDKKGNYCFLTGSNGDVLVKNSVKNLSLVEIHKDEDFTIRRMGTTSHFHTVDRNYTPGFFYGDAFYDKSKRVKPKTDESGDKTGYFIYNTSTFRGEIEPTSVNRVLNTYNSSSYQNKLQICKCTGYADTNTGFYYQFKTLDELKNDNGNSDNDDLNGQYSAGVLSDYLNMGTIDFGYVAPNGTSNKAQDYITDLNAYQLKFVRGIDSRSDRLTDSPFTPENNTYKINMIPGRNTLYIGIDYRANSEKSDLEALSQLPNTDIYGDLQALGEVLDGLDTTAAPYVLKVKKDSTEISLKDYFSKTLEEQKQCKFYYYKRENNALVELPEFTSFKEYIINNNEYWKHKYYKTFKVEFTVDNNTRNAFDLESLELVEAYTRGRDFLQHSYSTVRPQEQDSQGNKLIDFEDNYFIYKYSGREFCLRSAAALIHEKDVLLENDVTLGESYGRQTYFIEAIKYKKNNMDTYKDTFLVKDFLKEIGNTEYTEDDYEIIDGKIDLSTCQFYKPDEATYENSWCDCSFGGANDKECYYQKCGVCPYRFIAEKHPRRIRTLEQSKSNRFNLIQELSKVFEVYPQFLIEFDDNGRIKLDDQGRMKKHVAFMTEKGSVNYAGFRYEKNLSGINRSVDSQSITTKLYVETVDSELARNGICSIQTASDNIGKNSYILDLSYYTKKGLLNAEQTQRDIWGIDKTDLAFMPTIGKYNQEYDDLTSLIILNNKQLTELEAKTTTSITGVTTALEERKKNSQKLYQFKVASYEKTQDSEVYYKYTVSDTYKSYLTKYQEQATILFGLVEDLFFSGNKFIYIEPNGDTILIDLDKDYSSETRYPYNIITENKTKNSYCNGELWWQLEIENENAKFANWPEFKEKILDKKLYPSTGLMGQYVGFYNQNKEYKKQQQTVLNKINSLTEQFYKIYEPYIKEGTWTDSNYLTDNEYYWAANEVLHNSSKPQVSYDINVIDISPIEEFEEDYTFDIGDTTYVEDIDFFDINPRTGLPNREKVIISEITDSLDLPQEDSIRTQNYTTQFEDLFENISATVQSLTYNENTYKRASNFTAQQYIQTDSLQGALDEGNLTLLDANDSNIVLDESGTEGSGIANKASKYKLTGEGLYFSTDGGETWDIGVGPQGWNLDYAKFGQLDVSKVQIIDGKYIYFLWDKNGQ